MSYRETEPVRCVCGERDIYFKNLAHVIVGVGKSKIYRQTNKLETEGRVDSAVSNPKAVCR